MTGPITEREHAALLERVAHNEVLFERHLEDAAELRSRLDRIEAMGTMVRLIFGTSVVGAVLALLALLELVQHSGGLP